jgi:magnesium transporter
LRNLGEKLRPDQVLYHVMDAVIASYLPLVDKLEDSIEKLQDQVVGWPRPNVLESIGEIRSTLIHLRRVLSSTRHVAFQLRHVPSPFVSQDLSPFLRDVHDDLAIDLDTIAAERERLAGVLDVYLSSVANRTTEATRTLTLLGTAALPSLVITSLFGMNIEYPSWTRSSWIFALLITAMLVITGSLLWYLKRRDYLPGGTTSRASSKK